MWRSASGVKMTSTKDHSGLRAPRRDLAPIFVRLPQLQKRCKPAVCGCLRVLMVESLLDGGPSLTRGQPGEWKNAVEV
jgi:hypothetical protein